MQHSLRDVMNLIARVVVGGTFVAHAYQKFAINGMGATVEGFGAMGIPLPALAAWFTALVELFGGLALVVGVALPVAGALLALVMLGALVLAHSSAFFVANGGFEYVLVLAATSLALGFSGSRFTLAAAFGKDRGKAEAAS